MDGFIGSTSKENPAGTLPAVRVQVSPLSQLLNTDAAPVT
jgi:hypothetical protein